MTFLECDHCGKKYYLDELNRDYCSDLCQTLDFIKYANIEDMKTIKEFMERVKQ
jgi:endogenous inhibitor of DNA gyrase (YacG/DUF329 family)